MASKVNEEMGEIFIRIIKHSAILQLEKIPLFYIELHYFVTNILNLGQDKWKCC